MIKLISRNSTKNIMQKYQLSMKIRINEYAMAKEFININKDCHCVT